VFVEPEMYEHIGLATVLLILALAGNFGESESPCCIPSPSDRPALLLHR
jgi:hypothetical protein